MMSYQTRDEQLTILVIAILNGESLDTEKTIQYES